MRVTLRYDQGVRKEEIVSLEICEQELEKMVELDYQGRLVIATGNEVVEKKTAKAIIDELNKQEYNSWQTHHRHQAFLQKKGAESVTAEMVDLIADQSEVEAYRRQADYEALCQKVREALKPDQAEMFIAICLDGMSVKGYAAKIGDDANRVSKRFVYAKKILKGRFRKEA